MRKKNNSFLPLLKVVKQNKGDPREILGKRGHIEPTKIPRVEVLRRKNNNCFGSRLATCKNGITYSKNMVRVKGKSKIIRLLLQKIR